MLNWQGSTRCAAGVIAAIMLGGCTLQPQAATSLALVLCALAAGIAGWLLGRQQGRRALHAARQQARLLGTLIGGELWRTRIAPDATPRLEDGRRLGERFDAGTRGAELDQALARAEPLAPFGVFGPGKSALRLQALPCFADDGRFDGHLGVALPTAGEGLRAQALAALAGAWPQPLLLLCRSSADGAGPAGDWRLLQASASARQLLATAAGDDGRLAAASLQRLLPPALAAVLDSPGQAEADGWTLVHAPTAEGLLLVLWRSTAAADDSATLSYTVSHDLRAPIRVVEGFTRIVKEDYGQALDRVANDHLDRVLGAAARMNQMIDAMLTLARLAGQPLARQPVNLSQLAGYVIDDLRRSAPQREARVEIEPGLQTTGDPTLLRLVLENLLGNAWKYSAKRAQAHIVFSRETIDGRPVHVVRDNGAGFDMRSAERLFGLFQRLHSASEFAGTGVGLASVRRIVQRHGGEIWADGEAGRGAAFFFTLPQ